MKTVLSVSKFYGYCGSKSKMTVEANGKTEHVRVTYSEKIEVVQFLNGRSIDKVIEQIKLPHTDFDSEIGSTTCNFLNLGSTAQHIVYYSAISFSL